jgi:AcrR family transcriptional regulator
MKTWFSMPRSTSDPAEYTAILDAADAVLAARGFDALRVDDVLERAGLSTRAFYRHFGSKSELFLALFDRETARASERLQAKVEAAGDPAGRVQAWVEATLALAHDERLAERTRLFAAEQFRLSRQFPERTRRCVALQLAPLVDAIRDGRDQGVFPHADPDGDARAIHHLCAGLMADRLFGLTDESVGAATARAVGFALQTLAADGRDRRGTPARRTPRPRGRRGRTDRPTTKGTRT